MPPAFRRPENDWPPNSAARASQVSRLANHRAPTTHMAASARGLLAPPRATLPRPQRPRAGRTLMPRHRREDLFRPRTVASYDHPTVRRTLTKSPMTPTGRRAHHPRPPGLHAARTGDDSSPLTESSPRGSSRIQKSVADDGAGDRDSVTLTTPTIAE